MRDTASTPAWRTFPRTSTYRLGAMSRHGLYACALALLAVGAVAWPLMVADASRATASSLAGFAVVLAAFGGAAALLVRYASNRRYVLTPQGVTPHALREGILLPFSRLAAATLTRVPRGSLYKVRLLGDDGRVVTLQVEDFHLRDDALFHWLAAVPKRGGVDLQAPLPRRPVFERVFATLAGVPILALMAFLASLDIGIARDLVQGYPPLDRLSVVRGTVTSVSACERVGRNRTQIVVSVDDGGVAGSEALDCRYEPALRDPATPHQLAVWRDRRPFGDGEIRQVEVDGHLLASYADELRRRRAFDPTKLVSQTLILAAMALVGIGLAASTRERAPSER